MHKLAELFNYLIQLTAFICAEDKRLSPQRKQPFETLTNQVELLYLIAINHYILHNKPIHQMLINLRIFSLQVQILKGEIGKTEIKSINSPTRIGSLHAEHRIAFQVNVTHGNVAGIGHNHVASFAQIEKLRPGTDIEEVAYMAALNVFNEYMLIILRRVGAHL